MKIAKKMKERILSLALALVMVVSLIAGMTPVEAHADEAFGTYQVTIDASNKPSNDPYFGVTVYDAEGEVQGNYTFDEQNTCTFTVSFDWTLNVIGLRDFNVGVYNATRGPKRQPELYVYDVFDFKGDTTIVINPTIPVSGNVAALGSNLFTFDETENELTFNLPTEDDYIYHTEIIPVAALQGTDMNAEQYKTFSMRAITNQSSIVDVTGDPMGEEYSQEQKLKQYQDGNIYITNGDAVVYSEPVDITDETVVVVYKFHKYNVNTYVNIDEETGEIIPESPYFSPEVNARKTNMYAVYGVYADIVTPSGSSQPTGNVIDPIDVQFDWEKLQAMGIEAGAKYEDLSFDECEEEIFNITATGLYESVYYEWVIKVDETFDDVEVGDETYNRLVDQYLEEGYDQQDAEERAAKMIEDFQAMIYEAKEFYSGWMPMSYFEYVDYVRDEVRETDVFGVLVNLSADDGYTFGELGPNYTYTGTLTGNATPVNTYMEEIVYLNITYEFGTAADIKKGNHTHSLTEVVAKEPTCTTDGNYKYYKCDCGKFFKADGTTETSVEAEKISARHSFTLVPEKAATCTTPGNKAYYTCSGCDSLFADKEGTTTTADAVKVVALGHDWTGDWDTTKEATATEEGKKETYCTRDCGQKKVATISKVGEEDENGKLEKDAEVEAEAPIKEATLNNSKKELIGAGKIFTDGDKQLIEAGADARVWIEITKTIEATIKEADKSKMEKEATEIMGEDAKITYFDVDLFKKVGDNEKQEISEPGVAIKITIAIPEELLNHDKSLAREYKIIRLHTVGDASEVDVISGEFDATTGEFSFETDKFSTYAIVYADTPVEAETPVVPEVPNTGDSNFAYIYVLMLISGLAIVFRARKAR